MTQLRLLGLLRDRRPTMQDLAGHLGLTKSSLTGLIDRAEQRDLVRRVPDEADRRTVRVELTEFGHSLAAEGTVAMNEARMDALREPLSPSDRKVLHRVALRISGAEQLA